MGAVFGFIGSPKSHKDLMLMSSILGHRGEKEVLHLEEHVGLGERNRGTANIKLPLGDLLIALDGRIYSCFEEGAEVEFPEENTREKIAGLWKKYGPETFQRLNGPFALAVYDRESKELWAGRDHFGIKPLYYSFRESQLSFAVEIKGLLELPGTGRDVNVEALSHYLTFQYVPAPLTLFKDIYQLPAGHFLHFSKGEITLERYWRPSFKPVSQSPENFMRKIRREVERAVQLYLTGEESRNSYLSSGIDSSIITALLSRHGKVRSFCLGYADEDYSELKDARRTAELLGVEHHERMVGARDFLENLPAVVWHFDDPVADPAAVSLYLAAQMVGLQGPVVYSGEGADEIFGGYAIYREPLSLAPFKKLPFVVRKGAEKVSALLPDGIPGKSYIRRANIPMRERYIGNAYIFSPEEKSLLLRENVPPVPFTDITSKFYDEAAGFDEVARMQYIDLLTWMPGDICMKVDKMNWAHSLEVRAPYLHLPVFKLASSLPLKARVRGKVTKYLFRKSFEDLFPPDISMRPKRGFPVPLRRWVTGEMYAFMNHLIGAPLTDRWFNRAYLRRLLEDHKAGRADNSRRLWTVALFIIWHLIYMDRELKKGDSLF